MKKIVIFLLFLFFSFHLPAQTDYLEPVKPLDTYPGELGEYYRNVFSLLNTGFQQQPYARFTVIPSFSPEYAMSVEKKNGRYCLISNTLSRTYWQAEKGTVKVEKKSVFISQSLYLSLGIIFRLVTSQIQDLDGSTAGLDGIVYYFTSVDNKGNVLSGRKWSPEKGSLMERLVLVCQSAYLLTIGESISEDALANEADVLLKELQKRTKEQPNAHKRPIYVGIYEVGPQLVTNSGKLVGVTPKFSSGTPEEYVEAEMIYPESLLAKNIEGYVLCEFTIDKTGVVLRPHILKSTHSGFAEEVLRIVKGMPNWIPATTENKAVETNYTLYVPFRVQAYREHLQKKLSQK
ncbi:energy transducer TonB [Bacteroides faecalis]|uniref:energy transducer TonB n=1 Tax=Bacteroides faecalis TaxID=2447885 RepID=UPI000F62030D|nr:energy transducer TonB [Bacteroides faecalis]